MTTTAISGARIVLPNRVLRDHALILEQGLITGFAPVGSLPAGSVNIDVGRGWLLPGFIDTQVNGGGDVLFNDDVSVHGISTIASAHRRFGTTGLLPTLISDDAQILDAALEAVEDTIERAVPGVLGIHLEGPHLNPAKKGIHDSSKFTAIDQTVMSRILRPTKGKRLVTLAPELAPANTIRTLSDAGVIVAAGHSLANYQETRTALDEGLAGFTHLFNAMPQMGSREPGMVGAALEDRKSRFGIIVDGAHVHPATLRVALAARGFEAAMLVTDAMPPVGGTRSSFVLMGQTITVRDGICRGPDGTLAGSALSMAQAFRNAMSMLGCSIISASRLASGNPAAFLGLEKQTGAIATGLRADLVHLDENFRVQRTWIAGEAKEVGE